MRLFLFLCIFCYVLNQSKNGVGAYIAPVCGDKGVLCNEKLVHVFTKCPPKPSCQGFKICKLIYALRNIFLSQYIGIMDQIFESLLDEGDAGCGRSGYTSSKVDDPTLVQKTIRYWLGERKYAKQNKCVSPSRSSTSPQCKKDKPGLYKCILSFHFLAMAYSLYNFICSFYRRFCRECMPSSFTKFERNVSNQVSCLFNQFLQILRLRSDINEEEPCTCGEDDSDEENSEECTCNDRGGNGILSKMFCSLKMMFVKPSVSNCTQ